MILGALVRMAAIFNFLGASARISESDRCRRIARKSSRALSLSFPDKISPIRSHAAAPRVPTGLVSIVVPVFNESANLGTLWARLKPVLDALDRPWELVFIDDGSRDESLKILREIAAGGAGGRGGVGPPPTLRPHPPLLPASPHSPGPLFSPPSH